MCGRFAIDARSEDLELYFELEKSPLLPPRFNVTPGTRIAAIGLGPRGQRELHPLHWGFFGSGSGLLINARSETVHAKPSFAVPFAQQRCLVPATGFFEWSGEGRAKQPWFVRRENEALFGMAAIWQRMQAPGGETLACCTILTRAAEAPLANLHPRMPVVLPRAAFADWLAPAAGLEPLRRLIESARGAPDFTFWPVSRRIGDARAEGHELIERVDAAEGAEGGDLFE